MVSTFFKIAWRNLVHNRIFSVIKIFGLSIGLMVCMLIFLYIKDEISYDQFHKNKVQLYRIVQTFHRGNEPTQSIGITNAIVGESIAKAIPEVKQFVRVNSEPITVKKDNDVYIESPLFVDDNFLSVFTFPLLKGDSKTALKELHSAVLSKDMANKYFGSTDVIGKIIQLKLNDEFEPFMVTAVTDIISQNSTLKLDMLLPFKYFEEYNDNKGWFGGSVNTFLLLSPKAKIKTVENKIQTLFDQNTKVQISKMQQAEGVAVKVSMNLERFTDIHFSKIVGPGNGISNVSNPIYSYILTSIAIFTLIIACINFINLAIAQSLKRSKEIGIRKVMGSSRIQLINQFLTESFLISFIAFAIAILLTILILPFFNEVADKNLSFSYLFDGYLFGGFILLLFVTALLVGIYPSLVLSSFKPMKALYNRQQFMSNNFFTRGLMVFQFALAIFLTIGTIAINTQLNFLLHLDQGYDSMNLVKVHIPISKSSDKLPALLKSELSNYKNILSVAAKNGGRNSTEVRADRTAITVENERIDENYLPTLKIPIIAGRNFSSGFPADTMHSIIVNESFLKEAGWNIQNSVGKSLTMNTRIPKSVIIIGVVRDYHFNSLKEKITPQVFSMDPNFNYGEIWIKIIPKNVPQTIAYLQKTFTRVVPGYPFSYQFMDDMIIKNYETEKKWKQIISIASAFFLFISCMGLLGLVIISIEQRTKEIGIRKVLGAAIFKIILLISKEFILLIAIALLLSVPLGYYATYKWLQNFPYRIGIGWWMFALAGILVIVVAFLTMSFQAIKAAKVNPVISLRSQ